MDLHFFEYSNFTLNGGTSGESVSFPNAAAVDVQNGLLSLTETVATPAANEYEGDYYPVNVPPNATCGAWYLIAWAGKCSVT